MAFHYGTSPSSGSYREILTRLTAFCTSKNVTAAAVNAAGSGYAIGDLLRVTHASAYGDCILEVATVGGGGAVATVVVRSAGAFARRLASAVVNAGGSGYVVGDILGIVGGTKTSQAKVRVATIGGGGAIATVTLFETGGAYTVDPTTTGCTLDATVGSSVGTGGTLNLTMQAITSGTGVASTHLTGSGDDAATFNLTLVQNSWSVLRDWNNYSVNSVTDEKEVVLQGSAGGGNDPIIGYRTYTQTSGLTTNYGWLQVGMDQFNASLGFTAQIGVGPSTTIGATGGIVLLMFDNAQSYWFRTTGRQVTAVVKAVGLATTTYQTGIIGLLNPFGTTTEAPYPMYVSGSSRTANQSPDAGGFSVSGPTELFSAATTSTPAAYRRGSDGTYQSVQNGNNGTMQTLLGSVFPVSLIQEPTSSSVDDIIRNGTFVINGTAALGTGASATTSLMPSIGANETQLYPATLVTSPNGAGANDSETTVRGEIDGVFWISAVKSDGTTMVAEDTLTSGSQRYRVFQNAHRTERYSYFALKEN